MHPPSPESSARLSAAETNPLPHARAWSAITLPKAAPVIREKDLTPVPVRRLRPDGTEEIRVEDIVVIVPKHTASGEEELSDADLVEDEPELEVEVAPPEPEPFRPATVSVHATQEILADDVLAVQDVVQREERPSTMPWVVDTAPPQPLHEDAHEHAFFGSPSQLTPSPSQMSGSYRAVRRITNYSATQIFRRRSANVKVVAASVGVALSLVVVAAVARLAPAASSEGPVGIAVHAPKRLDKTVRARTLAYGTAAHLDNALTVSIDSLPSTPPARHRRWR
jgi:hypothetical protein